ncbi:hypothetical protein KC19_1G250800 [Ceratodon purpureus]|uniref:pectinesterase n=1 Tax=Ceratodon purpureus TaxID=3225 RepID=A0A8T0JBX9_CERPU|nr:hypothetical protein KC19_1G250800 [Ceratodon purpureus]
MACTMGTRSVNFWLTLSLLCLTYGSSVEAVVDPKAANRDATQQDFYQWVATVEQNHQAAVLAGTADPAVQTMDVSTLAASGNTLYVGKGGYKSVQAAVDAVPSGGGRHTIQISSGTWKGKVKVPKGKTITFEGIGNPVLVYGDTASSAGSTSKSASVSILADNFIARGVVFKNSAPAPPGGATGKQGVALLISGDKGAFFNCKFYGAQDTLYDQKGRHYFKNCYIEGSIDFICGDGQSLYQSCQLNSIAKPGSGSLTAQKRTGNTATGFSFVGCTITGTGPIYLGRAWGPNSRTVFIYCNIANIIRPEGWFNWGDSSRDKTVFYGQYKCTGAGANESKRVGWSHELTSSQANAFSSMSFIDGSSWVPSG